MNHVKSITDSKILEQDRTKTPIIHEYIITFSICLILSTKYYNLYTEQFYLSTVTEFSVMNF